MFIGKLTKQNLKKYEHILLNFYFSKKIIKYNSKALNPIPRLGINIIVTMDI